MVGEVFYNLGGVDRLLLGFRSERMEKITEIDKKTSKNVVLGFLLKNSMQIYASKEIEVVKTIQLIRII